MQQWQGSPSWSPAAEGFQRRPSALPRSGCPRPAEQPELEEVPEPRVLPCEGYPLAPWCLFDESSRVIKRQDSCSSQCPSCRGLQMATCWRALVHLGRAFQSAGRWLFRWVIWTRERGIYTLTTADIPSNPGGEKGLLPVWARQTIWTVSSQKARVPGDRIDFFFFFHIEMRSKLVLWHCSFSLILLFPFLPSYQSNHSPTWGLHSRTVFYLNPQTPCSFLLIISSTLAVLRVECQRILRGRIHIRAFRQGW